MPNYFNNLKVQSDVVYYNTLDSESIEAIAIKERILKEVRNIVIAIIKTHKFVSRFNIPFEECLSEGLYACSRAIPRFDPTAKKKNGTQSDLFTYMSIASKMAITYHGYRAIDNRIKDNTVPLEYVYDVGYNQQYHGSSIIDDFRSSYQHLFEGSELEAFNKVATFIETDRVHISKEEIIKAMKPVWYEFKKLDQSKPTSPYVMRLRINGIFKKIKEYEKGTKKKRKPYNGKYIKGIKTIWTKYPMSTKIGNYRLTV